ncbi:hypothetical protein DFH06DRAFT_372595 [Mycena polygramma]|nr:hypothetical protein DFH06DRAFT_372595 [Mycena polygramma]
MVACITANPDISGIGVRAAIYAQNLLCFLPVWAYLRDGTISPDEMKGVKDQSIGMLAIAFSILISTIIQATTAVTGQQISRFHAAVILDLSWMNNTSTWIWFLLYAHHLSQPDRRKSRGARQDLRCPKCRLEPGREAIAATRSDWAPLLFSKSCNVHRWGVSRRLLVFRPVERVWDLFARAPVLMLGSLHLSLMSAIGIWLWSDPSNFGTRIYCDPTLAIVGGAAPFSSRTLQIFSLSVYILLLIPVINLVLPIFFFLLLHIAYDWLAEANVLKHARSFADYRRRTVRTGGLVVGLLFLVVINIVFLVDIELTLARNKPLQSGEDGLWGFGQVLALLLLVMPLRDAWNALRDIQNAAQGVQERFIRAFREEVSATPFAERLDDFIREGAKPDWPRMLQLAAYRGSREVAALLLELPNAAAIETEPRGNFGTSLCAACAGEDVDMVKFLVRMGAKAELGGGKIGSALHVASLMGNMEIIQVLLRDLEHRQIEPNIKWANYGTALDVATMLNHHDVARGLSSRGLTMVHTFYLCCGVYTTDCHAPANPCVPPLLAHRRFTRSPYRRM